MSTFENTTVTEITSTSIAATAVLFFRNAVIDMIPWLIASIPLITLDLIFGVKAAKFRKERVTFSKAFRGTFGKVVEYFAWCCFAATASLAFNLKWVEWAVLGLVFINELASIIGNYLETKGIVFSIVDAYRWFIKWVSGKAGAEMSDEEAAEIIKPKPERDAKGRFVKKEK